MGHSFRKMTLKYTRLILIICSSCVLESHHEHCISAYGTLAPGLTHIFYVAHPDLLVLGSTDSPLGLHLGAI